MIGGFRTGRLTCWAQVLFATGDVLAQQGVEKVGIKNHSLARTGRMAVYGGGVMRRQTPRPVAELTMNPAIFGPAATLWFRFLQNKVRLPNKNAEIFARVAVDQVVFASSNLFMFLSTMSLMEGTDPREKLEKNYKKALIKNWSVWPIVQTINFKLVPLEHRVLLVNVIALGEGPRPQRREY